MTTPMTDERLDELAGDIAANKAYNGGSTTHNLGVVAECVAEIERLRTECNRLHKVNTSQAAELTRVHHCDRVEVDTLRARVSNLEVENQNQLDNFEAWDIWSNRQIDKARARVATLEAALLEIRDTFEIDWYSAQDIARAALANDGGA